MKMSSTYREENRPNMLMQAVSGYSTETATALPTCGSGFVRASRGAGSLGTMKHDQYDRMSTTHQQYMQGRIAPMQGLVVDIAPRIPGQPGLGQSGFVKNASKGGYVLPLTNSSDSDWNPKDVYNTTNSRSFEHPGLKPANHHGDTMVPASGLSSSFARAVVPVDRLNESPVDIGRLHPSVALLLTRRDPYNHSTTGKTFKVTQQPY